MAQFPTFYKYHGENGKKFKNLIVDAGLEDNKIGFPISAVDDNKAYILYSGAVNAKRMLKEYLRLGAAKHQHFEIANKIKYNYLLYIAKYHKVRERDY